MKFSALGLSEAVMKGISEARFTDCTPVQELVLPYSLANKDVMVQSKTGSGKTAVYIITILEKYMRSRLKRMLNCSASMSRVSGRAVSTAG